MTRIGIAVFFGLNGLLLAGGVSIGDGVATIGAGRLQRVIHFRGGDVHTVSLTEGGRQMLGSEAGEFSVVVTREQNNRAPRPLNIDDAGAPNCFALDPQGIWRSESFNPARYDDPRPDAPKWVGRRTVNGAQWSRPGTTVSVTRTAAAADVTRLALASSPDADGLSVQIIYEVYGDHPAVRKWLVFRNNGTHWLRLNSLTIDDVQLTALTRKPLAAAMFGVQPSVVAFEEPGATAGLIAVSEVPSALRTIGDQGAMGYHPGLFEWVLGPGEEFTSEPVFFYGYSGAVEKTAGGWSTPLDRAVERPYMDFLDRYIGIAAATAPIHGPQWMTWAFFYDRINDPLVRQLAEIAGRAGFTEMLFDDGWQKGRLGTVVDTTKFPDFAATAEFVRKQGMKLGLWVSCFRDRDSPDLQAMPNARVLPELLRTPALPGLAMGFASGWRDYYVRDLVALARRYGVSYYKQDFTAILYGDLAAGHESRTRRESVLRGLRGLLQTQAMLRKQAPDIVNEITHEIYWGTPGVPADLAALKTTARFHIPPNQATGADLAVMASYRKVTMEAHRQNLLRGCWLARQRFYSHRGLPLYPLEFYAAATTDYQGSLTPSVQDRQVASWLMGAPVCYSGDLRTLSAASVAHYRQRFEVIERLQKQYGIYKHFQFSGVPEPTDIDWHWWGKLNDAGEGAVVVVRGSAGAAGRSVNIPWVKADKRYRVSGVLSGTAYGAFSGKALQAAALTLTLPVYGQEILEIAEAR